MPHIAHTECINGLLHFSFTNKMNKQKLLSARQPISSKIHFNLFLVFLWSISMINKTAFPFMENEEEKQKCEKKNFGSISFYNWKSFRFVFSFTSPKLFSFNSVFHVFYFLPFFLAIMVILLFIFFCYGDSYHLIPFILWGQ